MCMVSMRNCVVILPPQPPWDQFSSFLYLRKENKVTVKSTIHGQEKLLLGEKHWLLLQRSWDKFLTPIVVGVVAHSHLLSPVSGRSDTLFQPLWTPGIHIMHIYTFRQSTHTKK